MAKINNTAAYAISTPVAGSDIVIGSALGNNGDTKNFQMSDISAYVMSANTLTLQDVCDNGSVTTTGITVAGTTTLNGTVDINNTADISGNTTIGGTLGVTGVSTLGEIDASGVADIADTLTLSKPTGTGLQVTSNANILGNLTVDDISSQIGNPFTISAGGSLAATVNTFARYTFEYGITTTSGVSVLDGVRLVNTPPASSVASGIAGDLAVDATYIYVCVGANSWGRVAIDTTPF